MAEVETDPLEAIKDSWVRCIVENFRKSETVVKNSGIVDLLAQAKEAILLQEEVIVLKTTQNSQLTLQELLNIANQVKRFPYRKPDLRHWFCLEWCQKEGEWRSIMVTVNPHFEALVIRGQEVKRLEKRDWQQEGTVFQTLMASIQKPIITRKQ